jgi:hypothetical protein
MVDGRALNAGWCRTHNDLRDLVAVVCEVAGIETEVEVETANLMQDDTRRTPGDVVLVNVNVPGRLRHTKFAVDIALASSDDGVSTNRTQGAEVKGVAARRRQRWKWKRGTRGDLAVAGARARTADGGKRWCSFGECEEICNKRQ